MNRTIYCLAGFLFAALLLLVAQTSSFAQQSGKASEKDEEEKPEWIEMMNDPNANYFEVLKAYNEWVEKESEGEEEVTGGETPEEESEKFHKEKKLFKVWQFKIQYYLRSDGSIMPH